MSLHNRTLPSVSTAQEHRAPAGGARERSPAGIQNDRRLAGGRPTSACAMKRGTGSRWGQAQRYPASGPSAARAI